MKRRPNPPLIAARSFEAAARHLSFQEAAAELHVTPTAISHQVKRLEEYLGLPLFVRQNRAVVLTPYGKTLAARLFELFTGLEDVLQPPSIGNTQALRVTAMPSLAAKYLVHRIAEYQSTHPGLALELSDDDEVVDFKDGKFDIALRYGDGRYPGAITQHWMSADMIAVCSPALQALASPPLHTPADVLHHTLIHDSTIHLPGKPPGWIEWLETQGLPMPPNQASLRYSSVFLAIEAARAAKGIALAPEPLVRDDLHNGDLVEPFKLRLDNPYAFWIVYPRHLQNDARVLGFAKWLLNSH
ncbi:LysR substrate-binding domain-containing protein [Massilia sp. 2TAF26]|uniref:LysR substrate-binding domain-containing protein n=1 Tax=Massilia sp. 2TAF26 TaxID=3233012 RepID=UPI003F97A598